jgi:signal peptidase I
METRIESRIEEKPEKEGKGRDSWTDLLRFAVICLLIVIPFRMFVAQPYIVEGSSMDPTFKNGDYLIVDQLSFNFTTPKRGDVIILKFPEDTSRYLIKRVIGLPNETVLVKNGKVTVKAGDKELSLDESYVRFEKSDSGQFRLGEGEYFVMGDNRAASSDSRIWGSVPEEDIVGKAIIRLLPLSSKHFLPGNITN